MSDPRLILKDGESCWQVGCRKHISHPCETCGRTGARGEMWHFPIKPLGVHIRPRGCNCKQWFVDLTHDKDCAINTVEIV